MGAGIASLLWAMSLFLAPRGDKTTALLLFSFGIILSMGGVILQSYQLGKLAFQKTTKPPSEPPPEEKQPQPPERTEQPEQKPPQPAAEPEERVIIPAPEAHEEPPQEKTYESPYEY